MTTEQTIALNQLIHAKANVRHAGRLAGIGELAASIAAHGLRQNLNVLPADNGRFEVVAGSRRLRAMKQLAREGKLAKDTPVPCRILAEGEDPAEISLVENAMRIAMHPDDQFEAFRALIEDKGLSVEEVAARFGVTPAVVRQRLKLANVSPKLRALFRKGAMGLEHVMALAISDDHRAQEHAWRHLPEWNREAAALKQALTHEAVPLSDRLARFVGVEAYSAAGGAIVRDLFDDEDEGYLADRALVLKLASAKLDEAAATVAAEGWKWVRPELTRDYSIHYGRVWPVAGDDGEEDENDEAQTFAPADQARAGALVQIGHDGALHVDRGLIHPDDVRAETRRERGVKDVNAAADGFSAALVADLTAHRTAALRIQLARNPAIALAATVHALALSLLFHGDAASCLGIRAASEELDRHIKGTTESPAHQAMAETGSRWGDLLPEAASDLWAWCLAQPQEVLLDLLAFLASLTVDAVQPKQGRDPRHDHADRLAATLALDMNDWWTPTVEGFYQRLPKAALVRAVAEAKVPSSGTDLASLKKADAARIAAAALAGSGWLPEALRMPA
jgi:ParB family chromosome partitioning protein